MRRKAMGLSERGFSIIELMVVVGLLGVLTAVAVPSYEAYVFKAKSVEAKVQLTSAYKAEKIFFAESGQYSVCLAALGYDPGTGKRRFTVGFVPSAGWDAFKAGLNCTQGEGETYFKPAAAPDPVYLTWTTISAAAFVIGALGDLEIAQAPSFLPGVPEAMASNYSPLRALFGFTGSNVAYRINQVGELEPVTEDILNPQANGGPAVRR